MRMGDSSRPLPLAPCHSPITHRPPPVVSCGCGKSAGEGLGTRNAECGDPGPGPGVNVSMIRSVPYSRMGAGERKERTRGYDSTHAEGSRSGPRGSGPRIALSPLRGF